MPLRIEGETRRYRSRLPLFLSQSRDHTIETTPTTNTQNTMSHVSSLWRRPMLNRNPDEHHRQASFLELFFDLCFVVAIAQAAAGLHHAIAADHLGEGLVGYAMLFFAIWWAWMNYTWFASAYDNDDVPFRLASFVQITGSIIIAAGIAPAFEQQNFDLIFIGYTVMRIGLVALWFRAGRHNPDRKKTAMRYVTGLGILSIGWGTMFVTGQWPVWAFAGMAMLELVVPYWAEKAGRTPWHPGHIAERFGLLVIIVLGESILAATGAVGAALTSSAGFETGMIDVVLGGLLTLFAAWWIYFVKEAGEFLEPSNEGFGWAYGHYLIFGLAAAMGAGLAVNIEHGHNPNFIFIYNDDI